MSFERAMAIKNILRWTFLLVMASNAILVVGQSTAPGPAPGAMINVGSHKLHINCVGPIDAKPTVVFESGAGAFSQDWLAVQRLLSRGLRTCAYDRAGLGWSDPGPAPRTLKQEVFELHALLEAAKISAPLVLVGQSLGALNVRLYTMEFGKEVAGIVLVDPTDESSMLFSLRANHWIKLREPDCSFCPSYRASKHRIQARGRLFGRRSPASLP